MGLSLFITTLLVIHPSELDIRCTKRVAEAGRLFDIPVLDHIIIGHGEFHSMSECGQV